MPRFPPPAVASAVGVGLQTAVKAGPVTRYLVATCCGLNCVHQIYSSPGTLLYLMNVTLFGNNVKTRSYWVRWTESCDWGRTHRDKHVQRECM